MSYQSPGLCHTIKTFIMKKIIFCTVLLAFAATSFCQQTVQKQPLTQTDYLQKSKKQKKTAMIFLGGGAALIVTSLVIPKGELVYDGICIGAFCSDKYKNDGIKAAFGLTGLVSMLGSVPFFIASGKNKRRAREASVFINMERAPVLQTTEIKNQSFPALGLRISL